MQKIKQPILISLSLFALLSTGCVPKDANGRYHTVYSYHPYKTIYPNRIAIDHKKNKNFKQALPAYYASTSRPNRPKIKMQHLKTQKVKIAKVQAPKVTIPKIATSSFTKVSKPSPAVISKIEQTAKSLLGTDYKYGANGPYQYDCSSFTKHVFAKQGITLPRVSREQAKKGQFIAAQQLQKGDLVFFDSKKSKEVSHVGIYLGRGDFIHASSAQDEVTISNLNSNYYSKHFKWGRRMVATNNRYAMK